MTKVVRRTLEVAFRKMPEHSQVQIDDTTVSKEKNVYLARSFRISIINWWNVAIIYVPYFFYSSGILFIGMTLHSAKIPLSFEWRQVQMQVYQAFKYLESIPSIVVGFGWTGLVLLVLIVSFVLRRARPTYLLDFACFEGPEEWKLSHEQYLEVMQLQNRFSTESLDFMRRLLNKSGTGQRTVFPPTFVESLKSGKPGDFSIKKSREEAATVIFDVVEAALKKCRLQPKDIDILILNCSLFSPTPSLSAMVVHHFKMRPDVKTYNLSGMGCSAGVISIDLAKQLLDTNRNSIAMVVSTETLTPNMYFGNERGMLVQNTLFRVGGAAMILSNKWQHAFQAKYKLLHTIRVQNAKEDALRAVYEMEDEHLNRGISLSKEIVKVAGKALTKNLTLLGPLVLPLREQLYVLVSIARIKCLKTMQTFTASNKIMRSIDRRILAMLGRSTGLQQCLEKMFPEDMDLTYYVPNFKRGIDHFCIHAGGRAVIDGVEKNLSLSPYDVEPSRHTLYNYGNTSSSSIWYELKYIEERGTLHRGDRILQIAFGSGFKCNSAVWLRL